MKTPEELAEEYAPTFEDIMKQYTKQWDGCPYILGSAKGITAVTLAYGDGYGSGFLAGYQAGRSNSEAVQAAASQWISVDKQLPELEIQCIWIDVRCIALNAMAARNVDDCEMWWNNYTHWMPLPAAPKEEV